MCARGRATNEPVNNWLKRMEITVFEGGRLESAFGSWTAEQLVVFPSIARFIPPANGLDQIDPLTNAPMWIVIPEHLIVGGTTAWSSPKCSNVRIAL